MFASQVTLSAIGPGTVVFTVLMGRFILKEVVTVQVYISCFLLVVGSLIAILYSPYAEYKFDIEDIEAYMLSTTALVLLAFMFVTNIIAFMLSHKIVVNFTQDLPNESIAEFQTLLNKTTILR